MSGRTWRNIREEITEKIRNYLLENGGAQVEINGSNEIWRVKFSDSTFTYYKSGTLYSTPSNSRDSAVFAAWRWIDSLVGSRYALSSKNYLIGLDETGKGETIGHEVLTGVIFHCSIFSKIDLVVGQADTKKRHRFEYWDDLFKRLDSFRKSGLNFITESIQPWQIDKYNINKMMDIIYQRILSIFIREAPISECRIVIDDYGIGPTLKRFLNFLEKQGAEVVIAQKADDNYLEAKVASLISKRRREEIIKNINENPEFMINNISVGTGNAGELQTTNWLKKWYASGKDWPWFVKRSFRTVREIEGKQGKIKKLVPPIREELLSKEFLDGFSNGRLSIQSLSLICSYCGQNNKIVIFKTYEKNGIKVSEIRCSNCKKSIDNAGLTLMYYCGYLVPDSSIIMSRLLSKDLEGSGVFENFTVVLPAIVRKECDEKKGGKNEFNALSKFASIGRIKLEYEGKIEEMPNDLSKTERDERIVDVALKKSAIILTADKSMKACCVAKDVFAISIIE